MSHPNLQIEGPRLVLARPQIGENIGFIARLSANFCLSDFCIVDPKEEWRGGAHKTASMCREQLDQARILHDLDEALEDCSHIFGFTARSGSDRLVEDLHARLGPALPTPIASAGNGPAQKLAFVFGNEESGLSREEAAHCTRLFTLALPGLRSLNLSHAVGMVLSEWYRHQPHPCPQPHRRHPLLDLAGKRMLATKAREKLGSIGFSVDDPHFDGMLRRLVESAEIETRDARILHQILTHLDWMQSRNSDNPRKNNGPSC